MRMRRKRGCAATVLGLVVLAVLQTSVLSAAELAQRFQGNGWDSKVFRVTGPGAASVIHAENGGLRITLPPEHGNKAACGLALHQALKGDFDVAMEFEILQVDQPTGGNGAGVSIWLTMVSRTNEAATIAFMKGKSGDSAFISHRATTPEGGKRKHTVGHSSATLAKTGKLRFERRGPTLNYIVESAGKTEEIHTSQLGTGDIDMIRFAADNGGSPTMVDVRIREITLRADDLGGATLLPPRRRWFTLFNAGIAAIVIVGLGIAVHTYRSR